MEIPPPVREYANNVLLLGVWHSSVTPPATILLTKIVQNIEVLMVTGLNLSVDRSKMAYIGYTCTKYLITYLFLLLDLMNFVVHLQLFTGDSPARSKCNSLVSHNGFYACSKCLFQGTRCGPPCSRHTVYSMEDFMNEKPKRRTQEHINNCAAQLNPKVKNAYGVFPYRSVFYNFGVTARSRQKRCRCA